MRTDAKIGFAIGAVLLAVLTVYAIVVPKHKDKKPGTVSLVSPTQSTPTGADTPLPTPSPLYGTPDTSGLSGLSGVPGTLGTSTQPPVPPVKNTGSAGGLVTPPVQPITSGGADNGNSGFAGNLIKPDEIKPDLSMRGTPTHPKPEKKISPIPYDVTDTAPSSDHTYTIKAGQTLSKIAYEVYGNSRFFVAIQRENKGLDPNHLKVGSSIKLPDITPQQRETSATPVDHTEPLVEIIPPRSLPPLPVSTDSHLYTVQSGDNLYAIARKLLGTGRKADQIYLLNKDLIGPDKARLKLGMVLRLPEAAHTTMAE